MIAIYNMYVYTYLHVRWVANHRICLLHQNEVVINEANLYPVSTCKVNMPAVCWKLNDAALHMFNHSPQITTYMDHAAEFKIDFCCFSAYAV